MIGDWSATRLGRFSPPQALAGRFTPVASLESSAWSQTQAASGLLVHPRLVVTVAHAVLFHAEGRLFSAAQVQVELGSVRAWADAVVIPSSFLQSAGFLPSADLAVLRMPYEIGEPQQPPLIADMATAGDAALWGWSLVPPRTQTSIPVAVALAEDGSLRYAASNLPAFSGGPLLRGMGPELAGSEVLGLHRAYHSDTQQGEAIVLGRADLLEAMRALGFDV